VNKTILLVDDNLAFREPVRESLELEGYGVIEVDDGENALVVLKSNEHVDLVVTDILMPEIEGNELAVKTRIIRPDLKIIGMTGGGRIGDSESVINVCATPLFEIILKKPFVSKDLLEAVERAFS